MDDESAASEAVRNLNGHSIKGRAIKVEKSESKGKGKYGIYLLSNFFLFFFGKLHMHLFQSHTYFTDEYTNHKQTSCFNFQGCQKKYFTKIVNFYYGNFHSQIIKFGFT